MQKQLRIGFTPTIMAIAAISIYTPSTATAGPIEYETEPLYIGFTGGEDDNFGYSLAIGGSYIAVGALYDDIDGTDSGAVYVYNRLTRNFLYAPFASEVGPGDNLGYSIAIDNNFLYASALSDTVGSVSNAGSVYVFDLTSNGQFHQRLTAPSPVSFDSFGWNVSASDGLIMVGAPSALFGGVQTGIAHAYSSTSFNYLTTLTPTDGTPLGFFGTNSAISANYVAVSSTRNDIGIGIGESGAVYLYDFSSGNLLHKLIPDDPQSGSQFGSSVAIQDNIIAIGAPFTSDNGPNSGSVYLFDAITGNQITKISSDEVDDFGWFGVEIAIDNDTLVIGAPFKELPSEERGSVFIYDLNTLSMIDRIDIPVSNGISDRFGFDVAAGEGDILTANYNEVVGGLETGVAYFIDAICPADLNDDGAVNFFDVSDLINNQPDYNGDGVFNFFDISAFISDYNMGCP
tara:strand:+ start:55036 stop:56409 length:1374 start_codon:yes stop_codon:yes gene_type:complete